MVNNLAKKVKFSEINIKSDLDHTPLKWCSVSLSEIINRGKRLEASVFDIDAKKARDLVLKGKFSTVPLYGERGIIQTAFYPGRFKRIYCSIKNGYEFYLPSQMSDIYPKPEKFISPNTKCNIDELKLQKNTLLLTRSGTIGNISLVSKTLENKVFSDDVIRVTLKNKEDLGYVYAYLKSKTGNLILTTNGYGSVITHLEPDHLEEIPIPNPPKQIKKKIHDLIIQSFILRDESNDLVDEATKLMIDELQFPLIQDFEIETLDKTKDVQTYSIKLSEVNNRFDASYHSPLADAIIKHIEKYAEEIIDIGDKKISKEIILPGRFKRIYVDEVNGRVFIGGKQIYELDPSNKKYLSLAKHDGRISDELEIEENTILITRSGTIGKVVMAPKHWSHWVVNEHVIRVVPRNNDIAGYLSIFLASEYGYPLIKRFTYGSVVDEIDDKHVSEIKLPLLKNQEIQKKINNLALEANLKRYEAYRLEQQALKVMDDEVIFAK